MKANKISYTKLKTIRLMEVCGTHTHAISKSGIRSVLPKHIKLLSGPGCPVCVTSESYIDMAIELLANENIILVTFGDMLKVKGTKHSLSQQDSKRIVTVYSPESTLELAKNSPDKTFVFLAVGFETTAPIFASIIKNVHENGPDNLFFLTSLKRMEPILSLILKDERMRIDGLICPGHVACVLGENAFKFISQEFEIPSVICGFETADIQKGIYSLIDLIENEKPAVLLNLYKSCVKPFGNTLAQGFINEVFKTENAYWRGIGLVENSALVICEKYQSLDAKVKFNIKEKITDEVSACLCSEIILGIKEPDECEMFGLKCTPKNPLGPCMVSSEGACSARFKYGEVCAHE